MTKTVDQLREEMKLQRIADMAEIAKGVIHNIDLKIKERKKWINKRKRQIAELEALLPKLDSVLLAEECDELPKFANLIAEAEETA